MRRRTTAILLSVLAAAALAGGAYAASTGSKTKQTRVIAPAPLGATVVAPGPPFAVNLSNIISDTAKRLHVSSSQLTGALKGAMIDQLNAAVKAGHLPAKLANVLKQWIEKSPGLPFGPGMLGPEPMFQAHIQAAPGILAPPAALAAAAKYLGLSPQQLMKQLSSGKSLAQVASAQHKSTSGLVQVLVEAAKSEIQKSAAAGNIPRALEQRLLAGLSVRMKSLISMKGPPGPPPLPPGAPMKVRRVAVPPIAAWWFGMLPPPVARTYIRPAPSKH